MLPSELETAKLSLENAIAKDEKAKQDLETARQGPGPVDSKLLEAAKATAAAVNQAQIGLGRIIAAFGQIPENYDKAKVKVGAAVAALRAAEVNGTKAALDQQWAQAIAARTTAAGDLLVLSGFAKANSDLRRRPPKPRGLPLNLRLTPPSQSMKPC